MNNIGIATMKMETMLHINMVYNLFKILAQHSLHLKLSKSIFLQPQMDFLGVHINQHGITVNPAKVLGLREYPQTLHNLKQARGFLGCARYHCIFCKDFSSLAEPISHLTKKDILFIWGPDQQAA
jgi:hypothetical protein